MLSTDRYEKLRVSIERLEKEFKELHDRMDRLKAESRAEDKIDVTLEECSWRRDGHSIIPVSNVSYFDWARLEGKTGTLTFREA